MLLIADQTKTIKTHCTMSVVSDGHNSGCNTDLSTSCHIKCRDTVSTCYDTIIHTHKLYFTVAITWSTQPIQQIVNNQAQAMLIKALKFALYPRISNYILQVLCSIREDLENTKQVMT